jgi:hypothetical protein
MGLDGSTLETLLGPTAPDLARIMPGLDARLTSAVGAPIPPEWMKVRLFDAVVGLLQRLGETTPAVFVFEDLHWADPASLDLIGFLVRSPRRVGTLTVLTYRSDELHRRHPLLPWLAEIDRVVGVERIDLERLTRLETAEQIGAILATEPSETLVDSIYRRSGGNPFFAEELIAADERGISRRLSSSLREILLGRLAGLGKSARAVVDVASVAGQPIRADALAAVAGLPEREVPAGIREALDAQILAPTDNDEERIGFRHALMQEAAYGDLLPAERRRLHLAFARMLEGQGEPDEARQAAWWAERAHHASAANDLAGALVASVGAGQAAKRAAAFADALRYSIKPSGYGRPCSTQERSSPRTGRTSSAWRLSRRTSPATASGRSSCGVPRSTRSSQGLRLNGERVSSSPSGRQTALSETTTTPSRPRELRTTCSRTAVPRRSRPWRSRTWGGSSSGPCSGTSPEEPARRRSRWRWPLTTAPPRRSPERAWRPRSRRSGVVSTLSTNLSWRSQSSARPAIGPSSGP